MGSYPLGGMDVQNNVVDAVDLFNTQYKPFVFTSPGAATYEKGMILARKVADDDLVAYVNGAGDSTGVPIAVLGSDVIAAGTEDIPLRAIVEGTVRFEKIHTLAGGAGTPIVADDDDLLQQVGIITQMTTELTKLDNQ